MVLLRIVTYGHDRGIADTFPIILCCFHRKYEECLQISMFHVKNKINSVILEAGLFELNLLY